VTPLRRNLVRLLPARRGVCVCISYAQVRGKKFRRRSTQMMKVCCCCRNAVCQRNVHFVAARIYGQLLKTDCPGNVAPEGGTTGGGNDLMACCPFPHHNPLKRTKGDGWTTIASGHCSTTKMTRLASDRVDRASSRCLGCLLQRVAKLVPLLMY
jgi:hypothetical protein